jgi:hypothetical protein
MHGVQNINLKCFLSTLHLFFINSIDIYMYINVIDTMGQCTCLYPNKCVLTFITLYPKTYSVYAQNDLKQVFFDMRCTKGVDVYVFLTSLCYKREELAAMGVLITQKEYQHTVLKSLPDELVKFTLQLLTSACIGSHILDTNTLITSIIEESKHLKISACVVSKGQGESKRTEILTRLLQLQGLRVVSKNATKAIATTVASQGIGHVSVANPKRRLRILQYPMHHKGIAIPLPNPRTSLSVQPMQWLNITSRAMVSGWPKRKL